MPDSIHGSRRWLALIVLCLGVVMIVLDSTVVNVALPSIRADLGFSETSLVWVVNAYLLTFGGFLLLGGRLGDPFGARRLFLIGVVAFTFASLACGLATSQLPLTRKGGERPGWPQTSRCPWRAYGDGFVVGRVCHSQRQRGGLALEANRSDCSQPPLC